VNSVYAFLRSLLRAVLVESFFFCVAVAFFLAFYSHKVDRLVAMMFLSIAFLGSLGLLYRSWSSRIRPK
jgi:hypothetical protein